MRFENEEAEEISEEKVNEIVGQTNFFYVYEEFSGDAEEARTNQVEVQIVAQQVSVAFFPTILPLYVLALFNKAMLAEMCEFRNDKCTCLQEKPKIGVVINILVSIHWILSAAELAGYYLRIPYSKFKSLVRTLFYISFSFFIWLTMSLIFLLIAWVYLGLNVNPLKAGPFVVSASGILLFTMFTLIKNQNFQTRISKGLSKGIDQRKGEINALKSLPVAVLDMMMTKNINRALKANGISFPSILLKSIFSGMLLTIAFVVLFIGFEAFSDPKKQEAGILNCVLTLVLAVAAMQVSRAMDMEEFNGRLQRLEQEIMVEINETIDLVARQSELAQKLIDKMGAKMKAHEDKTSDSDESEYSSSSSDLKRKGKKENFDDSTSSSSEDSDED